MSHEGPSDGAPESVTMLVGAARTAPLSPNTSAARLLTSDALTRALSGRVVSLAARLSPTAMTESAGVAALAG